MSLLKINHSFNHNLENNEDSKKAKTNGEGKVRNPNFHLTIDVLHQLCLYWTLNKITTV